MASNEKTQDVKQRIIEAAENLFAEKGFDKTSVRDITKLAGCNVASVNYYFSSKEKLHMEVFSQHIEILRDVRVNAIENLMKEKAGKVKLEELVRTFVTAFLQPFSEDSIGKVRLMLMWREMIEPHLPENVFSDDIILPVTTSLVNAIKKICPEFKENQILFSIESIVGQLVHIIMAQHFCPSCVKEHNENFNLQALIDHIVTFSTAGIKELAKKGTANAAN